MSHTLRFSVLHQYETAEPDITVPVKLIVGNEEVVIPNAKLDTGASACIFQREYGELLGLDVERGAEATFGTVTGGFRAYEHEVTLLALGLEFHARVFFFEDAAKNRNVLGRRGWLQQTRIGLVDHDGQLYVSAYGDEA